MNLLALESSAGSPVWSCVIEVRQIRFEDAMKLPLVENQQVIETLPPNTPKKAFTDRIGSGRMPGCGKHLDTTRCCPPSETRPKLTIIVTNEVLWCVSVGRCLPQLLRNPAIGRRSCYPNMDHFPRFQLDDEESKKRAKEQVGDLEEITTPDIGSMGAKECCPRLPFPLWRTSPSSCMLVV
jgi:hypothetical protein